MTQREAIIRALEARGWRQVPHPSRKYVRMEHSIIAELRPFWVGKAGALREGRTVTSSWPLGEKLRRELIEQGRSL